MSFPHRPDPLFNDRMTVFSRPASTAGEGFSMPENFGREGSIIFKARVRLANSLVGFL
jgi:hypothetical protein